MVPERLFIGNLTVLIFGALNYYSKISVHIGAITGTGTAFLTQAPLSGVLILSTSF